MDTVTDLALQGLAARLATLSGVTVERDRDEAVATFPSLVVPPESEDVDSEDLPLAQRRIAVTVEGYVQAATDAAAETVAHQLYADALAAIAADPSLGGVALDTTETGFDLVQDEAAQSKPTVA